MTCRSSIQNENCDGSLNDLNSKFLLGTIGRFNPQKDHVGLLKSLDLVKRRCSEFSAVLIGKDITSNNLFLMDKIKKIEFEDNISLLGQRTDIATIMNSLDVHILSSSFGEGFPNVVAEAMACGTPCITTDVGDAAIIVGDTGWVVPPKDPQALANAILEAMEEKQNNPQAWQARKQACRERIINNFSIEKMVSSYHQVWFN
ncbi:glycosyltransferase [Salinivibrio socompensis]|uniref:glycosyltransferase n=1 Tax=Salinivibrio socompensis TaxID=1510206 RepID=UPI001F0A3A85|nr:glycosyltransferase [Salinivibrio socompensis]